MTLIITAKGKGHWSKSITEAVTRSGLTFEVILKGIQSYICFVHYEVARPETLVKTSFDLDNVWEGHRHVQ